MKTVNELSIIEQVRAVKEEIAAEHGYSVKAIVESARQRQEASGCRIIRLKKKVPQPELAESLPETAR